MSFLSDALALGHVPRWPTVRHHRDQSVAEHSFNTAIIALDLYRRHPQHHHCWRVANLLEWALTHDIDECVTGDIPGVAKKYLNVQNDPIVTNQAHFTQDEYRVVKLADMIDAYTWIMTHGLGDHAQRCAAWMHRERLEPFMSKYSAIFDVEVVRTMVLEIIYEEGRLRT